MEEPMELEIVQQKLDHLRQLLENPEQNKPAVLQTFHDLFQLTHEGRNLSPESAEWLNHTAVLFLSSKLRDVLVKHSLQVYSFQLAALSLTDVDDVIDDLSNNGEILRSIRSFPLGAINKLKRELIIGGMQQQKSNSQVKLEAAPVEEMETNNNNQKKRLAEEILPHCHFIGKNPNKMNLYQLPLTKSAPSRSSKTDRWVFGSPSPTRVESKTILLMGATGSGKTTLINAMVNYIFGVEWDDPFRFMLINEEGDSTRPKSQMHSQTGKVTAYELHHQEGFKIPYSLIIVDTPGYGDTKGVERDYEITDYIQQFFKDDKGIQVLDAVGFTVQAALARLTPTQKYIFESILAIFGNDVRDNIRFLVTFTDGQTPPVLEAIKGANITHQPLHHRFNNSGFFTSNQMDGDSDFGPMFWKLGMQNFESFFSGLSSMKTISLTLTKEVLEERKRIKVTIEGLSQKIHNQLTKMEELRKTREMFGNHKDQIKANKNFRYTVTVSKGLKINISGGMYTTNCSKCSTTCHYPCTRATDQDKRKCHAMTNDGFCTICPHKCKWDLHTHQNYRWKFIDVTECRTYDDIKKKYEDAVQQKLSTEGVLQALQADVEQIKLDLKQDIEKITACLQRLDEIALRPDAFTTTDYIELMIQAEIREQKPGAQERIRSLTSLLDNARVVQKIRAGEDLLPEAVEAAGQSCSSTVTVTYEPPAKVKKTTLMDRVLAPWVKSEPTSD